MLSLSSRPRVLGTGISLLTEVRALRLAPVFPQGRRRQSFAAVREKPAGMVPAPLLPGTVGSTQGGGLQEGRCHVAHARWQGDWNSRL